MARILAKILIYIKENKFMNDLTINYGNGLMSQETITFTMDPESKDYKKAMLKALNNPTDKISNLINQEIEITDVFCHNVECVSQEGEVQVCPRIVLFDKSGNAYESVSFGVYNSVKNIFAVFGHPSTWDQPIKVKIVQINKKEKKMLSLQVI